MKISVVLSRSDYADILLTALSPIVGEIELEKFIQGLKDMGRKKFGD